MRTEMPIQVNTLDKALQSAKMLMHDLARRESKTYQGFRVFSALASDEHEGLIAFLIWKARGELLQELVHHT